MLMNNSDFKYVFKRVLVFIIISIILFCFNSCKAHALTQTVGINYYDTGAQVHGIQCTSNYCETPVYNEANYIPPNIPTYEPLKSAGEGNFVFTFVVRNAITPSNIISGVRISNNSDIFQCEIGTTYTYNDNQSGVAVVTANCPVNFKSGYGLKTITFERNGGAGTSLISWSKYGTFISKANVNVNVNQQQVADAIQASQTATIQALEASSAISHQDAVNAMNQAHTDAQQAHQDAQQAHTDSQNINNSINDTTPVSNNEVSGNTSEWSNNNLSNNTITSLLTLPLTLIQAYLNGINSTCSSFNLGSLFGTDLVLPCINVKNYLGNALWSTIDILFSGFMILNIGKKLIKIFNDFTNLNNNQADELYGGGA